MFAAIASIFRSIFAFSTMAEEFAHSGTDIARTSRVQARGFRKRIESELGGTYLEVLQEDIEIQKQLDQLHK